MICGKVSDLEAMNSPQTQYSPQYDKSWALIVGINDYRHASPLNHARADAEAVASLLESTFDFPSDNVQLLLDKDASRRAVRSGFLALANDSVAPDDRVIVFFAGHGQTRTGRRGEVGFLVPADGDPEDLATLIRWDELTQGSELIRAKHLLFIMDACYGGLAITRSLAPGSSRFLRDMLTRFSRQVLTAGKADELVSDAGGPRPGHSVFTGHLLNALEGEAESSDGIVSANVVMAYVYDHVAKDPESHQSPHYGFIQGDGDLIFSAPKLNELTDEELEKDIMFSVPAHLITPSASGDGNSDTIVDNVKNYLSEPKYRIALDDLVGEEVRSAIQELDTQGGLQEGVNAEEFVRRVGVYESAIQSLVVVCSLIARWGDKEHQATIGKIVTRLSDENRTAGGKTVWLGLRWYPLTVLMYTGGIAALFAGNYQSLKTLLLTKLGSQITGGDEREAIVTTVDGLLEVERAGLFKRLPGHEKNRYPRSEYLFKSLQPQLEDLLFLGSTYEELFDRFEVLYALVYADLTESNGLGPWGPPGRFAWKHHYGLSRSPYTRLIEEAKQEGATWEPLRTGFFDGSLERFLKVATDYSTTILNKLSW